MHKYIITLITTIILTTFTTGSTMAQSENKIKTHGVHHIGLAVKDLQTTSQFFIDALDFKKVGEKPKYPAIFVSDGNIMVTLWQVTNPEAARPFDRKNNIGLHHMAFKLSSFEDLDAMHEKIKNWPGVRIEFSPELMGDGPAKHMIFTEPGGIRLEFTVVPE